MMFKSIIVLALLMASFVATNANDTKYGNLRGLMDTEKGRELKGCKQDPDCQAARKADRKKKQQGRDKTREDRDKNQAAAKAARQQKMAKSQARRDKKRA